MGPISPSENDGFLYGKLLIAMPGMPDPRFENSVIFMCAHSDQGAMGLIVNKPIEGLMLRELLEKLDLPVSGNARDAPIMFGGPMRTERGFVLHSGDYRGDETTMTVTEDVSLTATVDILRAIAEGHGPRKTLLALGYAGWGPGQIESEISANGWIHCDTDQAIIFDAASEAKWRSAFAKLGADISGLSAEAGRA
jgi:putative transcriptional regulator